MPIAGRHRRGVGRVIFSSGAARPGLGSHANPVFRRDWQADGEHPGRGYGFLAISIVAFVILGSVLEGIPAIVLFGPLLFPIARAAGVHEVHYAMVVIFAMGIGLFAPPFGVGYYGACAISRIDPVGGACVLLGYIAAMFIGLILVAAFPWFSIGLPQDLTRRRRRGSSSIIMSRSSARSARPVCGARHRGVDGLLVRDARRRPWYYNRACPSAIPLHGQPYDGSNSVRSRTRARCRMELIQTRNDAPSMYRDFMRAGDPRAAARRLLGPSIRRRHGAARRAGFQGRDERRGRRARALRVFRAAGARRRCIRAR
jgi:hypothetical protein